MFDTALTANDLVFLAKGAGMTLLVTAISVFFGTILLARQFNRILARLNPDAGVQLLQVSEFSPAMAMLLADRVAAGEFVAIAADRVPVTGDRICHAEFLGATADFPAGPWLIASLLRCPVWGMSCLHDGDGYRARIDLLRDQVRLPRGERQQALDACAATFADWLTACLRQSPYDWFNFYDFWKPHADVRNTR